MINNINDKIFDFVYAEALNDATIQMAYTGNKKDIENVTEARNVVKKYVDYIVFGNVEKQTFDDVVENVKSALIDHGVQVCYKGNKNRTDIFGFGNIQKLVNMTAKYFYILYYKENNEELRERFRECHCPMDSIMIKKVWKEFKNFYKDEEEKNLLVTSIDKNGRKRTGYSNIRWSKLDFSNDDNTIYCNFQKMVSILADKKGLIPIEFDYNVYSNAKND